MQTNTPFPHHDINWQNVQTLLLEGFSVQDLRSLILFHPDFEQVKHDLSPSTTFKEMVTVLLAHAKEQGLGQVLLAWAQEKNPRRYDRHAPYYYADEPVLAEDKWQAALAQYKVWLREQVGTMIILGKPDPVPVEEIYTDVYVLDKPQAWERFTVEGLEAMYQQRGGEKEEQKRHNGFAYVQQHPQDKLFVLGKPGAGKTTFLKYLTLQALAKDSEQLPIFVSLKGFSDSEQDLLDFMCQPFVQCGMPDVKGFLHRLLKEGKALLLFDGLDEVSQEGKTRGKVIQALKEFSTYNRCPMMITCRIAAEEYRFPHFTTLEMADFAPKQVARFVAQWFGADEEIAKSFIQTLKQAEHEGVQELTRTPILLCLLCLIFESQHRFPERRVDIYEEALDILLRQWDESRNIERDQVYRALTVKRKKKLLAEIAYQTFSEGAYFIPKRRLVGMIEEVFAQQIDNSGEEIDGEEILYAIIAQHGLLVERAKGIFSFSHLTFQEYFTACYIVGNEIQSILKHIIKKVIKELYYDIRWKEVFLFTASLLNNADEMFNLFLFQLDETVKTEPHLVQLLQWVNKKAIRNRTIPIKPSALRASYIFLGGVWRFEMEVKVLELINLIDSLLASDLMITFYDDPSNLSYDYELDITYSPELDLPFNAAIELDPELGIDIVFTLLIPEEIASYSSLSVYQDLQRILALAKKAKLPNLIKQVQALDIPENNNDLQWKQFISAVEAIMEERQLNQGLFLLLLDKEPEHIFSKYLEGNKLLVECLKVARVSDREGIENRILLINNE